MLNDKEKQMIMNIVAGYYEVDSNEVTLETIISEYDSDKDDIFYILELVNDTGKFEIDYNGVENDDEIRTVEDLLTYIE